MLGNPVTHRGGPACLLRVCTWWTPDQLGPVHRARAVRAAALDEPATSVAGLVVAGTVHPEAPALCWRHGLLILSA